MYNILINRDEEKTIIAVVQNGDLVEIYNEKLSEKRLEGNIYLGKVRNIITGMQSAFIDIGEIKNALVHIKDIIPKASNVTGNSLEDTSKVNIKDIIKSGEEVLVQVKRDCNEQKGPKVTKDIKINGKFVIFMPYSKFITVSQKIQDENEKERLKAIVKEVLPKKYGIIIRTAANGRQKEEIQNEIKMLMKIWNGVLKNVEAVKDKKMAPVRIFDNSGMVGKIITDLAENDLEKIYTNVKEIKDNYVDLEDRIENLIERFGLNVEALSLLTKQKHLLQLMLILVNLQEKKI